MAIADGIAERREGTGRIRAAKYGGLRDGMAGFGQNLRRQLDVDRLTQELNISERHLNRIFHDSFGCTVRQQHQRLRLERGRALLEHGGVSVKQAAAAVGFDDALVF